MATVYLIHFDHPFGHSSHYLGFAERLDARVKHHRDGTGALLLARVNEAGIGWNVVRTWENQGRVFERRLKKMKKSRCLCPVCNPTNYAKNGKTK
jgi:predicted GIY-YIG superfamily endonuclease